MQLSAEVLYAFDNEHKFHFSGLLNPLSLSHGAPAKPTV